MTTREKKEAKTFDNVEASPLTENEKSRLSRRMILDWYKAHRLEKLKALQDEITSATFSEKEGLKEKIVENTKKELETHKELTAPEKERQAKKFADDLIKVDSGSENIESVAKYHVELGLGETLFFSTLDEYTGKERQSEALKNLMKHDLFKKLFESLKQNDEKTAREIEMCIKEGNYDELKKKLIEASGGKVKKENIDQMFGIASFDKLGKKELTGISTIDTLITSLGSLKFIGNIYPMQKAAEDFEVPYFLVVRLATQSLKGLKQMDDNLQKHKILIEEKENKSTKDLERINFIQAINRMRSKMDEKISDDSLESNFSILLEKYLDKKVQEGKLNEQTKLEIKSRAKLEDLRLIQLYSLTYGKDEDRERLWFHLLSRLPTMIRFHTRNMGEGRDLRKAISEYHGKRLLYRDAWHFKREAKKWGLAEIMGDMNKLESGIKGNGGQTGKLFGDAEKYKLGEDARRVSASEMYDHDLIMKNYRTLSTKASEIMTQQAKDLINAGKELDPFKRTLAENPEMKISELNLSDKTKKAIFPALAENMDAIGQKPLKELVTAYGERMVELRTMHDVTRARFQALAETIDEKVGRPFGEKLDAQQRAISDRKQTIKTHEGIQQLQDQMTASGKVKRFAKYGALPTFLIGAEIYELGKGTVKPREVAWDLGEAAAGFVPFLGTSLDFKAWWTEKSLSGKKLGKKEKWMSFGFGCIGLVADASYAFAGAGMFLRTAIGGARSARRSVTVAREGQGMVAAARAVDVAEEGTWLHKGIMGVRSRVGQAGKAGKFESGLEGIIRNKAYEQSMLMSKCGLKETDDINAVRKAMSEANVSPEKMAELKRLEGLLLETTGGSNYLKIFNEQKIGRMSVPESWLGRTWMGIKSSPRKFKEFIFGDGVKKLKKLGFSEKEIERLTKNFEKMRVLQDDREVAVKRLAELTVGKERKFAELKGIESSLGKAITPEQRNLLDVLEKERVLTLDKTKSLKEIEALKIKYKGNKEILEIIARVEKGEKVNVSREFMKFGKVEKGAEKLPSYAADLKKLGFSDQEIQEFSKNVAKQKQARLDVLKEKYKHDPVRLNAIKKLEQDIKVEPVKPGVKYVPSADHEKDLKTLESFQTCNNEISAVGKSKKELETSLEQTHKDWLDSVNKNHGELSKVEREFEEANTNLLRINTELKDTDQVLLRFDIEMQRRVETLTTAAEYTRTAAKYLQYGGFATGAIWYFTGKHPGQQIGYAADAAYTGGKYAVKAGHELYIADHSGTPALDVMIDEQIDALKRQQGYRAMFEKAKGSGESEMVIAQRHFDDPEMQRELRERGMLQKVMDSMKEKGTEAGGEDSLGRVEYAASDASKKLKEKI